MTPLLIGVHGVKRSGKGTAFRFVKEWAEGQSPPPSVCERGFADMVKWIFSRQFFPEISMEEAIAWCDEYKDSNYVFTVPSVDGTHKKVVPFRLTFAQFATDGMRRLVDEEFWPNILLPINKGDYGDQFNNAEIRVITDVRFLNEIDRIAHFGGLLWKIRRKDSEDAVVAEAKAEGREIHASELGIPDEEFDRVFVNDDNDIDRFRKVVFTEMDKLYGNS